MEQKQFFVSDIKCNFNLRQPRGCRPTPIYFVVRINGKQLKFATGVKVCPSLWSKRAQAALVSHKLSELDNHNNSIVNNKISVILERFSEFKSYLCSHIEELSNCESILKYYFNNRIMVNIDIYKYLIDKVDADENLSDGTAVTYKNKLKLLDGFLKYKKKRGQEIMSFKDLSSSEVFAEYQHYLCNVAKNKREANGHYNVGYANNVIKNLHTVLKYAVAGNLLDRSQWTNTIYELPKNKTSKNNEIYLRDDEIMQLYNHQCENVTDELVRDIFLLECLTGQRISDVQRLSDSIDENGVITLVQCKTSEKVRFIPVFDLAKKILIDKYDGNVPSLSTTTINKRIKLIAKAAGINGMETISKHYTGSAKPHVTQKERWKCVTTHTGRRTFISLLFLRDWSIDRIGKYTGQKDVRTIERYNKLDDVDYNNFKNLQKNHPELVLRMVDDAPLTDNVLSAKQNSKKRTFNEEMFAETTLLQLQELDDKGIDIYTMPETQIAIRTIKSIKHIEEAKTIIQAYDQPARSKLIEQVKQLDDIVHKIAKKTTDTDLYKMYRYKMQAIGDDCEIPSDDDLLFFWRIENGESWKDRRISDQPFY